MSNSTLKSVGVSPVNKYYVGDVFMGVVLGALCVIQLMQLAVNLFFEIGLAS